MPAVLHIGVLVTQLAFELAAIVVRCTACSLFVGRKLPPDSAAANLIQVLRHNQYQQNCQAYKHSGLMASVTELKDAGSSASAAGKHKEALDLYTQALDQAEAAGLAEGLHVLFSNRYRHWLPHGDGCCMEMAAKSCSYMLL